MFLHQTPYLLLLLVLLATPEPSTPFSLPREGKVAVPRIVNGEEQEHEIWYKLVRPMTLTSKQALPLVVLHGGPGVPSDYLFPLSELEYRSVLFYDQLGCGRSDAPPFNEETYSIEDSVADLQRVLKAVGINGRYHLLGQSFGGMLAFEHVLDLEKRRRGNGKGEEIEVASLVLANTPACVATVEAEAGKLAEAATAEVMAEAEAAALVKAVASSGGADDSESGGGGGGGGGSGSGRAVDLVAVAAAGAKLFHERHNCMPAVSTPGGGAGTATDGSGDGGEGGDTRPAELKAAYAHAAAEGTWRGTGVVRGWTAAAGKNKRKKEDNNKDEEEDRIATAVPNIPVLCLRGERDFVTRPCVEPWERWGRGGSGGSGTMRKVRMREVAGTGHMCHLEDRPAFNALVGGFLGEYDD